MDINTIIAKSVDISKKEENLKINADKLLSTGFQYFPQDNRVHIMRNTGSIASIAEVNLLAEDKQRLAEILNTTYRNFVSDIIDSEKKRLQALKDELMGVVRTPEPEVENVSFVVTINPFTKQLLFDCKHGKILRTYDSLDEWGTLLFGDSRPRIRFDYHIDYDEDLSISVYPSDRDVNIDNPCDVVPIITTKEL
jgi:hypothetical protein